MKFKCSIRKVIVNKEPGDSLPTFIRSREMTKRETPMVMEESTVSRLEKKNYIRMARRNHSIHAEFDFAVSTG